MRGYQVDGVAHLARVSHDVPRDFYWSAAYGDQADPDLAKFT